jgi:hypothetical protein
VAVVCRINICRFYFIYELNMFVHEWIFLKSQGDKLLTLEVQNNVAYIPIAR